MRVVTAAVVRVDQSQAGDGLVFCSVTERELRKFQSQRFQYGAVRIQYFRDKYEVDLRERFAEPLARFAEQGYLQASEQAVTLTREGLLRADSLLPAFFLPEHRNVRYA